MKKLYLLVFSWSHAQLETDHFREGTFLATSGVVAVAAWLWVGQGVAAEQIPAKYGLLLAGIIAGAFWGIYSLYHNHYLQAVVIFLSAQMLFLGLMILLYRDLTIGYLFLFTVVMAGTLMGPVGSIGTASGAAIIEGSFVHFIPNDLNESGILLALIVVQYLAALISAQSAQGLYAALEAAEISARSSHEHAEEARKHRGELHRTLKSLDTAYAQLQRVNAELLQAREIADSALHFKKEFAAQTSHELRTPLNLIIGFSETMAFSQSSYGVKLPSAYLRDVTEIHRNSRHLLTLIDDILDLSKLESGRMGLRFTLVDIHDVLLEVVETIQPLTQAKKLELVIDVSKTLPSLWLDRARIHQVLLNLLSNAARLTKRGRILLQARVGEQQNELLIQVKDTGPGIPADMLTQVFEEFQQVGDTTGSSGTTGLGLAISKRIIELHGGRIWAESEVGVGSQFSFVLPVHEPYLSQQVHTGEGAGQIQVTQPTLVVLGEESSDEIKLLQRHLDGFVLASASNWKNAKKLIEKESARVIITNEPVADGFDRDGSIVPIISCPIPSSKKTAQALGVASFIRKPLTIKALHTALKQKIPGVKSLLIIDDDPSTLRLIERMLQGQKSIYKVFRAYTSVEALARIREQSPDAILLDLDMSDDAGITLMAKLKNTPKSAKIPMIAISGREIDETVPNRPITISSPKGFTPSEILNYLQAILSVVPPLGMENGTNAPPLPAGHPG